jgi:hypothetical protein
MFAVGNVILFVTSGVCVVVLGGYFIALAARFYLTTVQETAVGIDAIDWPRESPTDWIGSAVALLVQGVIWIAPGGFLARALASTWLPDNPPLRFAILMGLAAWLLFPPGFLLTMASAQVANPARRLLFGLHNLLLFYVLSGFVCVLGIALAYQGLLGDWYWLPLAGIGGPMLLLLHARLVGRLGYFLGREEVTDEEPAEKPKKTRKAKDLDRPEAAVLETRDPWADSEVAPPPRPAETTREVQAQGYGLAAEEPPPRPPVDLPLPESKSRPRKRRRRDPEPEDEVDAPGGPFRSESAEREIERERKLREREDLPPPRSLFFHGVWEFPLYPSTLEAVVWLFIYSLLAGGMLRFMISVAPFGGGDG